MKNEKFCSKLSIPGGFQENSRWHCGTQFNGHGGNGLMVELDESGGLIQPE